jgi:hypothetical protein
MSYNSTIKQKKGECIDCNDGVQKPLIAGRCSYHYPKYRGNVNAKKASSKTPLFSRGTIVKSVSDDLDIWFKEKENILSMNPYCMECGAFITPTLYGKKEFDDAESNFSFRHAIAHIFPKAQFPSVRTAPFNYLILPAKNCGCHNKTHRLDTFSKMKVFPLAIQRFRTFEKEITESHKYLDLFKSYINDTI